MAAALLLLSQGGGPLRVAAALAILSIVLIGLSITLRRDTGGVTAEMEATLVEELELLREDVRDDIRTAAKATHAALLREVQTLRGEVDALRGGRPQPGPVTATASVPVPQASGLVHHTETVQVTTRQTTLTADHPHGRATPYTPADEAPRRPEPEPRWTEGRAAQPEGTEYGARPALETSRIEPSTVLGPRPAAEPARPAEYGRRVEEERPRWEPEPAPVRARPAEESRARPVEENRARPAEEAPARAWQPPSPPPVRSEPRRYDDSTSVSQYEPRRAEAAPRYESGFDSSSGFAPRRAEPDRYEAEPARYEPEPREPSWSDAGARRAEPAPPRRAEPEPRRAEPESRRAEPEPRRAEPEPRRVEPESRRAEPDLRGSDIRAELRGSEPRRAEPEPRRAEPEPRRAELDVRRPEPEPGRFEMDGPTRNRRAARRAEPDDEPSFSASLPALPRGNDPWADLRSQDAPGSTRSAGESWAEVRSDERGGEVRMGERRAELRTDEYGQELRVADRWASIRQEPAEPERATRQPAERSGRRAASPDRDDQASGWRAQESGGDERTESGWSPPRDYDDSGYRARYTEEEPRRRSAERGWQPPQEDYPREERWR
ncbi:hypothetical protein AB0M43_16135 [Longispora sp. NPDC051575]|uniref:hypothetical protein n=1 Tax=Longispora sp. NPDC051575 TaxID=3154943 RepID=UPI00341CF581